MSLYWQAMQQFIKVLNRTVVVLKQCDYSVAGNKAIKRNYLGTVLYGGILLRC